MQPNESTATAADAAIPGGEQHDIAAIDVTDAPAHSDRPTVFSNTVQECLFVLATTMAVGQGTIFSGSTWCITTFIGDDLRMDAAEVVWISAGQKLAAGCFLPLFGRFADLFGRRMTFLTSMFGFSFCLLIMGFATDAYYVDIFSGFSGIFSAMAVPPAVGKLGAVYATPSKRKNRAFACFSAGNPVGFALGAFISGITMSITTWRSTFWVISVIYALFSVAAYFFVPPDTEQRSGGFNRATFAQFDFFAVVLIVSGIGLLTAALTLAANAPNGWATGYVIALIVVGVVLIAGFVYWESICRYPLMPLSAWRDRNFTLLVSILCLGFGINSNGFWTALFWQRVQRNSPIIVAVKLLPMMVAGLATNVIAALIMHRVSNKLIMIVGCVCFIISNVLFSVSQKESSYWDFNFVALILYVVGGDLSFTITNMYVMSSMPTDQQSAAGALLNTMVRIAGTIGSGAQTSVYTGLGGSAFGEGAQLYRPYQATYFVSLAGSILAMFMVPFVTVQKQGVKTE